MTKSLFNVSRSEQCRESLPDIKSDPVRFTIREWNSRLHCGHLVGLCENKHGSFFLNQKCNRIGYKFGLIQAFETFFHYIQEMPYPMLHQSQRGLNGVFKCKQTDDKTAFYSLSIPLLFLETLAMTKHQITTNGTGDNLLRTVTSYL